MSASLTVSSYIVAEISLHSNGIYGAGTAALPILVVSLQFVFRCAHSAAGSPERAMCFRELRCKVRPADAPHGLKYLATSLPMSLERTVASGQGDFKDLGSMEIPLDRARVAAINRARNGEDVKLSLDFELLIDDLSELAKTKDRLRPSIWGFTDHHRAQGKLEITIPRSVWVERVLPNMEFETSHIIELPAIPIEACKSNTVAFAALLQAQKLERQGFYKEAVAQCRIALEPFCEPVEKTDGKGKVTKVPKLKSSWETRLGQHTYEWLNNAIGAVRQGTNPSHHHTTVLFGQFEAQMLLMVATALIAYAVKTDQTS